TGAKRIFTRFAYTAEDIEWPICHYLGRHLRRVGQPHLFLELCSDLVAQLREGMTGGRQRSDDRKRQISIGRHAATCAQRFPLMDGGGCAAPVENLQADLVSGTERIALSSRLAA